MSSVRSRLVALTLLLGLHACADGERPADHGRLHWLSHPAAAEAADTRRLASWDLSDPTLTRRVDALESTARDGGLELSGGAALLPVSVTFERLVELTGGDQFVLHGWGNAQTRVTLELRRDGRLLGRVGPVPLQHDPLLGTTTLDLPAELAERGPVDQLVLHCDGRPRAVWLARLELRDRPDEQLVPAVETLVSLDTEARLAIGLVRGRALEAAGPAPPPGRLRLALGRPPASRTGGVLVVSAGARELRRVQVGALPGWREVSVPWPGGDAPPRLSLEAAAGTAVLVAEARVEPAQRPAQEPAPRRVLLITSDTHRGDHLGAAPDGVGVQTPVLDALAARGLRFDDCFVSSNFTNPSHAALMTGVSPRDTGLLDNSHALLPAAATLAERFAAAGFRTWAAVSAAHLRPDVSGLGQGFERVAWPSRSERPVVQTLDQVLGWLGDAPPARLFLWVHVFDAHMPYEAPAPFDRMYYDGPPDPFDPGLPDPGWSKPPPGNLEGLRVPEFGVAQYAAQVSWLDHELGRLLGHPALADATVALVGDHGESLGAHDIWYLHDGLYPDTLHVPLLLSAPGGPAGVVRSDPVSHLDLGRTLLDLAGLDEADFPGRNLSAPRPAPRFALAAHGSEASLTADGQHLVLRLTGRGPERPAHGIELYDLATDPRCERDLAAVEPGRAAVLRARLVEWLAAAEPRGWVGAAVDDAETREQLRQLGYVEVDREGPLFSADGCDECLRWQER